MIRRRRLFESDRISSLKKRREGFDAALSKRRQRSELKSTDMDRETSVNEGRVAKLARLKVANIADTMNDLIMDAYDVFGNSEIDFSINDDRNNQYRLYKNGPFYTASVDVVHPDGDRLSFEYQLDVDRGNLDVDANFRNWGGKFNSDDNYTPIMTVLDGLAEYISEGNVDSSPDFLNFLDTTYSGEMKMFLKDLEELQKNAKKLSDVFEDRAEQILDDFERKKIRGVKESRYRRNARLVESRRRR